MARIPVNRSLLMTAPARMCARPSEHRTRLDMDIERSRRAVRYLRASVHFARRTIGSRDSDRTLRDLGWSAISAGDRTRAGHNSATLSCWSPCNDIPCTFAARCRLEIRGAIEGHPDVQIALMSGMVFERAKAHAGDSIEFRACRTLIEIKAVLHFRICLFAPIGLSRH
jgi:hypothetical protein